MYFTPVEIKERHAFVDRSIEVAQVAFGHPDLIKFQGSTVISAYRKLLDEAIVANYSGNGIELPSDVPADTDRLVIAAVTRANTPLMSAELGMQTATQKQATIRVLKTWAAKPSAYQYYNERGFSRVESNDEPTPYPIPPLTLAMTGSFMNFIDLDRPVTRERLPDAPSESIAQIAMRPTVMLVMGEKPHAAGEVLAHELAHVRQITQNPVRTFRSQRSIDMASFRDELEAYHIGADVAYIENGCKPIDLILPEGGADLNGRLQSIVESLRRAHGVDTLDPYRPSPSLLKTMHGLGEMILHQRLAFEDLRALLN